MEQHWGVGSFTNFRRSLIAILFEDLVNQTLTLTLVSKNGFDFDIALSTASHLVAPWLTAVRI